MDVTSPAIQTPPNDDDGGATLADPETDERYDERPPLLLLTMSSVDDDGSGRLVADMLLPAVIDFDGDGVGTPFAVVVKPRWSAASARWTLAARSLAENPPTVDALPIGFVDGDDDDDDRVAPFPLAPPTLTLVGLPLVTLPPPRCSRCRRSFVNRLSFCRLRDSLDDAADELSSQSLAEYTMVAVIGVGGCLRVYVR